MTSVKLSQIRKTFEGHLVLDGLDLEVESGEYLVLLGPSGCGKTTTLQIIAGLQQPDRGGHPARQPADVQPRATGSEPYPTVTRRAEAARIEFDGKSVASVAPRDRDVAMVFQHDGLYPHLTVEQSIRFAIKSRYTASEVKDRLEDAIRLTRTDPIRHRYPNGLSGGELRRAAIAKAIARRTSIRLLDEPLSALDTSVRHALQEDILRWHASVPGTTVHVTHDGQEAIRMADRIAVMEGGIVSQIATPLEVFHNPATLAVARAIGTPPINLLQAKCIGAKIEFDEPSLDVPIRIPPNRRDADLVVGVRAEAFRVTGDREQSETGNGGPDNGVNDGIVVTGEVLQSRWMPGGTQVRIRAGDQEIVAMFDDRSDTSRPPSPGRQRIGARITLTARQSDVHFFELPTGKRIEMGTLG